MKMLGPCLIADAVMIDKLSHLAMGCPSLVKLRSSLQTDGDDRCWGGGDIRRRPQLALLEFFT
jgi:hypothetical protein